VLIHLLEVQRNIVFFEISHKIFCNSIDIIINNENVDINEDGTVFNDTDGLMNDENMNLTTNMIRK
jgi:hypothetical protein